MEYYKSLQNTLTSYTTSQPNKLMKTNLTISAPSSACSSPPPSPPVTSPQIICSKKYHDTMKCVYQDESCCNHLYEEYLDCVQQVNSGASKV